MSFSKGLIVLLILVALALLAACGGAAQPETVTVVETVVVEKEVDKEVKVVETVEVEVEKVVEVEKEVEVEKVVEVEVEKEVLKEVNPVTYNSMHGDPEPRRVDEMLVQMFNEQNPETPVQQSIIAHEDFKQAIRAYLVADPAPDVMTWFATGT